MTADARSDNSAGGISRVGPSPHARADMQWPLLRASRGQTGALFPHVAPPRSAGLVCVLGLGLVSVITWTSPVMWITSDVSHLTCASLRHHFWQGVI